LNCGFNVPIKELKNKQWITIRLLHRLRFGGNTTAQQTARCNWKIRRKNMPWQEHSRHRTLRQQYCAECRASTPCISTSTVDTLHAQRVQTCFPYTTSVAQPVYIVCLFSDSAFQRQDCNKTLSPSVCVWFTIVHRLDATGITPHTPTLKYACCQFISNRFDEVIFSASKLPIHTVALAVRPF